MAAEPREQEVEEWAEREKKRREAWVAGPSEAEKSEWMRRRRERRELRERLDAADLSDTEVERELERRLRREAYLARVGMVDLLLRWPPRLGAKLIRAGLDAQYDFYTEPAFRRRVPPEFPGED